MNRQDVLKFSDPPFNRYDFSNTDRFTCGEKRLFLDLKTSENTILFDNTRAERRKL
jgi:hypothetical protein